jgi:hypothetical protein
MDLIFKPSLGSFISESEAQLYGERLFILQEKNEGKLNAKIVVEDAKNPRSPLHKYFNWDNGDAANKWREHQARILIGSIHIVVKETGEQVRAFQHLTIKVNDRNESQYIDTVRVLSEPELRKQMLERALKEFNSLRRKYQQYKELAEIFIAIDRAEKQLEIDIKMPVLETA